MHNQRENRSLMRIVKQNPFKNLGELHKKWTEAGVKASRAPHTILEHFMLPSADQLFKDADFILQQDLAPAHTAKSTKS